MRYTDITFELEDGVATITLDRPDHLNAFTGAMGESLARAYHYCDESDDVKAVVVTGRGRAFCAGADMSEGASTFDASGKGEFSAAGIDFPAFRVRKLVIAAMNGHAVGIGFTLALQADLRIVAEKGKYGILQVRRGVMGDAYSHWTLPRIVGMSRAADILLTGRTFGGTEAVDLGIASQVLPADEVLPAALEIARDVAVNAAPLSVAVSKRLLWESMSLTPDEVEHAETALHHHIMNKPDAIEGSMAYLEKREPKWSLSTVRDWPHAWPTDCSTDLGGKKK